jgi:hypothetical protein
MRARWVAVALVPLGTVLGHVLGYAAAGRDAALAGSHGHLRLALWPAVAATVAALAVVALGHRASGRRGLRLSGLLVAQVGLFAGIEAVEHLHAGHGVLSVVAEPAVLWGLGAQLLSAALLVTACRLAHTTGRLVRARLGRRPAPARAVRRRIPCQPLRWISAGGIGSSVSERGPPGRLAAA